MGAVPKTKLLEISKFGTELNAKYLLENREIGIINLAAPGIVIVENKEFLLNKNEAIYIGKGNEKSS
ncbi:hypothetical protein SCLARK_001256 [Spiroplasma clarkii]|nr:hypothetical protein SCLARK_001256 [Spiroplasma clarkii]